MAPGEGSEKAALIIKVEVLLDRAHYSPGQIDGKDGENFRKALKAFQQAINLASTGEVDADTWNALTANVSEPVLKPYTITEADVAGPFEKRIPGGLEQASKLQGSSIKIPLRHSVKNFTWANSCCALSIPAWILTAPAKRLQWPMWNQCR